MMDITKKVSQAKFAQLVGITQPAVSGLVGRGVLKVGDIGSDWLLAYCGHLREVAAGRSRTDLDLDPDEQLARLRAAQADKVEMENQVKRGELVSVHVIEEVLASAGSKVSALFDAIPAQIKRRAPSIGSEELGFIEREITKARNTVSQLSLEDIEGGDDEE